MQIVRNESRTLTKRTTSTLLIQTTVQEIEGSRGTTLSVGNREATLDEVIEVLKGQKLTLDQARALSAFAQNKLLLTSMSESMSMMLPLWSSYAYPWSPR